MSPPRPASVLLRVDARLAALAALSLMGCGSASFPRPDFVDCQPRLDFSAQPPFAQAPRLAPVGARHLVGFAFDEVCPVDLDALAPSATAVAPDTSVRHLDVRLRLDGTRLAAEVDVTPDVEGWWMVELSLDPGWARRQVLVRAVENRASAAPTTEAVNGSLTRCFDVQRTTGGTWVCRTQEGAYQLRAGIAPGFLGQQALVVGDAAWATDGLRVVRFDDSPTGLRVVATLAGAVRLYGAEHDVALVGEVSPDGAQTFTLVRYDGSATLVPSSPRQASEPPLLVNGEAVETCPGPLCRSWPIGLFGARVLVTDQGGARPRLVSLDGGAVDPVDVGPGTVQALGGGLVAGNLPAVWSSTNELVLLRVPEAGPPRMEWVGPGLFGATSTHAFLRGARDDEVQVVPLAP